MQYLPTMAGSRDSEDTRVLRRWFGAAFLIAIVIFVLGVVFADDKRDEVGFEAAKAALQLGVITGLGAVFARGLKLLESAREDRAKALDQLREDRRRLHDYRLAVFHDTVDAYHEVKEVRRTLRAFGFDGPAYGSLTAEQIGEFHTQMRALNKAELAIEKIRRELEAQSWLFPNASRQGSNIEHIERYLRNVLRVWEAQGPAISANDGALAADSTKTMDAFLARRREAKDPFWDLFKAFENAMRADLVAPTPTARVLA